MCALMSNDRFVKIPLKLASDPSLRSTDIHLYMILRSFRNEKLETEVFPSRSTLAHQMRCSIDTVDRSIKRLEKGGYIHHKKGGKGFSNRYFFVGGSRTGAAISDAGEQPTNRIRAPDIAARERHDPETENQNKYPERGTRLFHGKDKTTVLDDGKIRIHLSHSNRWVFYGGGDDEPFTFGNLKGKTAREAAIKMYKTTE